MTNRHASLDSQVTTQSVRQHPCNQAPEGAVLLPSLPSRPFVVDLVGPSGVGKDTLGEALQKRDRRIATLHAPGKARSAYHLLKNSRRLLPPFVGEYRGTRWFTRHEMRYLAGISALYQVVQRRHRQGCQVVVVINGPLYRLARLRLSGPPVTRSEAFQRWHDEWQRVWSTTVRLMVRLDAPDHELLRRVNARDGYDWSKGKTLEEAKPYFARQRRHHEAAAGSLSNVLRIDTARSAPDELVERTIKFIAAMGAQSLSPTGAHADPTI